MEWNPQGAGHVWAQPDPRVTSSERYLSARGSPPTAARGRARWPTDYTIPKLKHRLVRISQCPADQEIP